MKINLEPGQTCQYEGWVLTPFDINDPQKVILPDESFSIASVENHFDSRGYFVGLYKGKWPLAWQFKKDGFTWNVFSPYYRNDNGQIIDESGQSKTEDQVKEEFDKLIGSTYKVTVFSKVLDQKGGSMAGCATSEPFSDRNDLEKHVCETACKVLMTGDRATFHLIRGESTEEQGIVECYVDVIGPVEPEHFRIVST